MPQDKIKEVYDLISDLGYFSDENEFRSFVSDPKKRKEAYSLIADAGYFKDENEFNSYFEPEKKKPTSVGLPRSFQPFQEGVGQSVKIPFPSTSTSTFIKTPTTTTPKAEKPDASLLKSYEAKLKEKKELLAPFESKAKELDARLEEYNKIAKNNNNQLPPKQYAEYKAIADKRNALTEQYKKFYSEYTQLADKYNVEFKNYNAKIGEFNKGIEALNAQAKKAQEAESKRKFDELQKLGRNPAQRIKLYSESARYIQSRIPDLVEKFNLAEQSGNVEEAQMLQKLINADSEKLKTYEKLIQGQKMLAAMNEKSSASIGLMNLAGALASGVNFFENATSQMISDVIGFKLSDEALKEISDINKKIGTVRPSDAIAKLGKEILTEAGKETELKRVNMPYQGGVWEALINGDVKAASSNAGSAFVQSLPQSLLMANPITGTLVSAGMAQQSVDESISEKGSASTFDYLVGMAKAGTEYVFENMFGTGKSLKELVQKLGNESAQAAIEQTIKYGIKDWAKKVGVNITEESLGEGATQITQNLIDIANGKKVGILDGVGDATLIGLFGGMTQGTATTTLSFVIDRNKAKEYEAKKEQAIQLQEQALEAPSEVVAEAIENQAVKINEEADAIAKEQNEIGANADPEIIDVLAQENADLDELEAALPEAPPEVQEAIQAQIEEKTKVIEKLTKEARISALERLKVAEQEITPQEPKIQEDEKITAKEENVEPMLEGVQPNRDEVKGGEASTELRTDQKEEVKPIKIKNPLKLNSEEIGLAEMDGDKPSDKYSVRQFFSKEYDRPDIPMFGTEAFDSFIEENKPNTKEVEVKISDITPTQALVDRSGIGGKLTKGNPIAVRFKGSKDIYLLDGHHRTSTEVAKGNKNIKLDLIYIDKTLDEYETDKANEVIGKTQLQKPIAEETVSESKEDAQKRIEEEVKPKEESVSESKEDSTKEELLLNKEQGRTTENKGKEGFKEQKFKDKEWNSPDGLKRIDGETTINGKEYYTISIDGKKTSQVILKDNIEKDIIEDEKLYDNEVKKEKVEIKKDDNKLDFQGFGDNLGPLQKSNLLSTLSRKSVYNGVVKVRKNAIEDFINNGYIISVLKNGKRVLKSKDGSFLDSLTKAELDYAEYLLSKKENTDNNIEIEKTKEIKSETKPEKEIAKPISIIKVIKSKRDGSLNYFLNLEGDKTIFVSEQTYNKLLDKYNLESIPTVEQLLTNKPQEDAIKSGKIEQSSESERKGVTEQKQGEQEDRVNQEEPITKGQASPSGSDSVSEGGQEQEVKPSKLKKELLKGDSINSEEAIIATNNLEELESILSDKEAMTAVRKQYGVEKELNRKILYLKLNPEKQETSFDFSTLVTEQGSPTESVLEQIDREREESYQKSGFDKKWAATYKEAKKKLIDSYIKAKSEKENAESKQIKSAGGKSVFVGDEVSGKSVSVDSINKRRRENAINNAQEDMKSAISDLKALGLSQEEIDSEIALNEVTPAEVESVKESPKAKVREKVVKIVENKSGKSLSQWKKESLALVDKVINAIIDNETSDPKVKQGFLDSLVDLPTNEAKDILEPLGVKVTDKLQIVIPTPQGEIKANISTLVGFRKQIASLSDSSVVSNENTRLPSRSRKVDAQVAATEFYEPESQEDADFELSSAKESLDNAKKNGNKKLIELAQVQYDFYKDWADNFDRNTEFKARMLAEAQKRKEYQERQKDIESKSKELNALINKDLAVFKEAGIYNQEDLYDFLEALGIKEIPTKMTKDLYANLFAKAAIDSNKHTYLTYAASIKDRKRDVPKVTAKSSWKKISQARDIENQNKEVDKLLELANKYESEATKIFKELTEGKGEDRTIRFLDSLKIRAKGRAFGILPPFAIPIGVWNAAIDTIILGVKAGRVISEVVQEAIDYINANHGKFDEKAFKDMLVEGGVVTEDELVVEGEPTDEAKEEPKKDTERKPKQGSTPNSRVRSHYTTVTDNKTLSNITDELDSLEYEYEVKPEKSDKEKAIAYIEKYGVEESYQNVIDNIYNEELAGSEANALASLVYGALSKAMALAIKEGDMAAADIIKERSRELIKKVSERGTDAGRFVNSFKYFALDFSNPETAAYNLQKEVEEINKKTREKSSNISNANNVAKDIAKEVKKGKAKVVSEVVKDIDEMLYGTITKGKKGLTPEQKAKVKSVFEAFKVNKDGKVQSSVVPIKEIIAAIVTPEKYNQFIDKVADAVAEGVSLSVAMTRVSAEFIKNNIATPKEMAAARKALTEQVNGIKTKKPLTEKQIERRKASEELKAATERFNLEKQLEKEKKKAEDLRQKDAEKVLKEVEKLELQRTRQNIKDLEKAIKDLQNQVKTDEELVNEIITEYLSLEGDTKTKNEKLVKLVKDNIEGLTDSEARVIATKIAKGVAEKIKKKLETKFGSALSKEEQEQKKVSATPKTKEDILDQLVKASNLGAASPQLIMDFFQNKYGIQNLSAEDVNGIIELSKALANAPTKNRKGVILAEIQKVIDSKKKRTLAELLQNLWYARVLSPVLTGVLGTGDVNLAYNILAVKLNMIEAPLTASINSMKYIVKDIKGNIGDKRKVSESIKQNLLGLLTDGLSASLAPFVQRVNYDADANLFKTIIKNPTLLRESITYFTESLSNGLAFKKDTENPFTATGASTFNISNYLKYFEDARKGDKKAKAIIGMAVNKYVNSVTNMLGGQDLAFGTMVGRGYMSTLVREKLYKEGLRGKELNSKVLETILDTKIQGELAAEKALSNRMNFDISIDLQMDNNGNTYYIIKDKGKVYKERQGIRLIEKRFDSKDEAIDYAREVVAHKSNTFRLDVINILNERLGEDVLKNMNRISSNDLLSAQAEGSARLVFKIATSVIDNLNKLSDAFNEMSKNLDTYDWKDILGMAKEKDIDAVKGIIRKVLKYITKTISILVRSTANLLAFMRVGLNSVRNQSSYIFPIGVLRYFASYFTDDKGRTRSLLSTMSYEMSDTEKSKILAKAMIGAYTFSATAYLSTFLMANAGDDDEDKETLEERERARELFRSWYKEKTGEDLPRNIDDFYFKLTKGDVIGSLNWLRPEEYKFYKKTGLFPENSIFLGFDAKGKPIFESILNDPSYAMAVSASTYKLIQAFGDEEQKEMAKINAAITPFYSWKDMTIGQGGISVLLGNKKPQEKMETIVQVSVLDNLEVLSPRIIPVTLQYFYPEARRTDNLFEAIERQESIVKGSGQFFIQRVFPLTAGWYQSTQAPKMYGMLGETIVRVPAEKQGLFSAYYAKLLRESLSEDDSDLSKVISKKLNEWYNTNQTIDESKLYIWMAANGKRTSFKPPVEQAIVNGDGEIEKLTMSQKEKYEPKAALKSKDFLLKNLYKLQILREVGGETTEDKEKAFSTEIQKIFKQNFLNEYYLGEKSFGDKTAEMVAASVNNMQTKLDDKVNSAIIEYIKRTEKNKDIKITPEEEEMVSKGYTAEQYLAFIKNEEDKMGKLERARLVGILTQEQFMKSLEMLGKFKSKSGLDDYLKNNKPF